MALTFSDKGISNLLLIAKETARQDRHSQTKYIDQDNNVSEVRIRRHTVIFGRRGSGKTTLLKQLIDKKCIVIWVDADLYKDLTFPDTLIEMFRKVLISLSAKARKPVFFWRFTKKRNLAKRLRLFETSLSDLKTEFEQSDVVFSETTETTRSHGVAVSAALPNVPSGSANIGQQARSESTRTSTGRAGKINQLNQKLQDLNSLIEELRVIFGRPVFVVLDDFYHVRVEDQAKVLDYMARVLKNTDCFLKVTTIGHRSKTYRAGELIYGLQSGHDASDISLDRSFRNFPAVDNFLKQFWIQLCTTAGISEEHFTVFAGESWTQLVLASGGVPRDFLNIFVRAIELGGSKNKNRFDKALINEAANLYFRETKKGDLSRDSRYNTDSLDKLLRHISEFCVKEKRKNLFLVPVDVLDAEPQLDEFMRQLCDFRFIHEVHENTSSSFRPRERFKAFMLDVGIYAYPERRKDNKVEEILFWTKDDNYRMDSLRNSPIYDLNMEFLKIDSSAFDEIPEDEPTHSSMSALSEQPSTTPNQGKLDI